MYDKSHLGNKYCIQLYVHIYTVKTTALEFTKLLYEAPEALEIRANTSMLQWKTMVRARALDSSAHNCSLALRLVLLLFLTELALS